MTRIRIIGIAAYLTATLALSSCGGKPKPPAGPDSSQGHAVAPANELITPWQVQYTGDCEGEGDSLNSCPGAYGFRISSDGGYRFGPGPDGQTVEGFLSDVELGDIEKELRHFRNAPTANGNCESSNNNHRASSIEIALRGTRATSCDPNLSERLGALAARYSPESFPNPCVDADAELRKAYRPVLACQTDADCSFVDESYLPLDASRRDVHELVLEDCSFVARLPVANTFRSVQFQRELLLKRAIVKKICGKSQKAHCSAIRTFDPWESSARCVEGQCTLVSFH